MSKGPGHRRSLSIVATRSDYELLGPADIVVLGGPGGALTLRANAPDAQEARRDVIQAVRAGAQRELVVRARVFRQRDGSPNLNHYRIKPAKLPAVAASFKGMPILLDHNKWEQGARIGTILESASEEQGHSWIAILQSLKIVKPEAVISVLDGTLDRFSIGWRATGAVLCTAHGTNKLSSGRCSCWPGDTVEIDGVKHVVEFEWQDALGVETSAVNVPAVSGTRIEEITALAVELGLPFSQSEDQMAFPKLAALLGVAALAETADEDRAARVVEELQRDKKAAEQERDAAIARAEAAEQKLTTEAAERKVQTDLARKAKIDAMLEQAYQQGKLLRGRDDAGKPTPSLREARLRRIGMEGEHGEEALAVELSEMPRLAPVGERVVYANDPTPPKNTSAIPSSVLASTARQLGLDPKELEQEASKLAAGEG